MNLVEPVGRQLCDHARKRKDTGRSCRIVGHGVQCHGRHAPIVADLQHILIRAERQAQRLLVQRHRHAVQRHYVVEIKRVLGVVGQQRDQPPCGQPARGHHVVSQELPLVDHQGIQLRVCAGCAVRPRIRLERQGAWRGIHVENGERVGLTLLSNSARQQHHLPGFCQWIGSDRMLGQVLATHYTIRQQVVTPQPERLGGENRQHPAAGCLLSGHASRRRALNAQNPRPAASGRHRVPHRVVKESSPIARMAQCPGVNQCTVRICLQGVSADRLESTLHRSQRMQGSAIRQIVLTHPLPLGPLVPIQRPSTVVSGRQTRRAHEIEGEAIRVQPEHRALNLLLRPAPARLSRRQPVQRLWRIIAHPDRVEGPVVSNGEIVQRIESAQVDLPYRRHHHGAVGLLQRHHLQQRAAALHQHQRSVIGQAESLRRLVEGVPRQLCAIGSVGH